MFVYGVYMCDVCVCLCNNRNERFHWKYPTTISNIENETAIVRMSESFVWALEIVRFVYVIAHPQRLLCKVLSLFCIYSLASIQKNEKGTNRMKKVNDKEKEEEE